MEFINNITLYLENTWLKWLAVLAGLICVYLNKKEKIGAFFFGIVSCVMYIYIFYHAKFYADMWLQVIFIGLSLQGWYQWLFGGKQKTELHISNTSRQEYLVLIPAGLMLTGLGYWYYGKFTDAVSPFWDSFNTAFSLVAQYLLNLKRLENWLFWILVDVIYIPLFIWRKEYETAFLYSIFLVLAIQGFLAWRKKLT